MRKFAECRVCKKCGVAVAFPASPCGTVCLALLVRPYITPGNLTRSPMIHKRRPVSCCRCFTCLSSTALATHVRVQVRMCGCLAHGQDSGDEVCDGTCPYALRCRNSARNCA